MGKYLSVLNPFRNFNIEGRAHKAISQTKPSPAPKYEADQKLMDRLLKENPSAYQESLKKDPNLDNYLKNIYVTSSDAVNEIQNPERPLPADRKTHELFLYGMKEPNKIPLGKATLRQMLEYITKHQSEPREYTAAKIANELLLPEEKVRNILKYFRIFEMYIPQERNVKAKFAGPSLPKIEIIKRIPKKLPLPSDPETKEKT